jgi:cytochrome c-type protein NapC
LQLILPDFVSRFWKAFWRPIIGWPAGGLMVGGVIAGAGLLGAFNWSMELSNTESFCISCHEMRSTVYQELQKTVHWANPTGVRAICSDCHVPKAWGEKVLRKAAATFNELPKHVLGVMDTREEFNAQRLAMAREVWADMKASDSQQCRNCHRASSMMMDRQRRAAQKKHERAFGQGDTCIDCHQGIAHELPEGWEQAYDSFGQQN